jgi:hypothetical protein
LVSRWRVGLRFHPPSEVFILLLKIGLEAERETAFEGLSVAFGNLFITGGTTLLLRALRGQQMSETRRAANELTG